MTNDSTQYIDTTPEKTPAEIYDELCNLQQLVTYLTDEQLEHTIRWCSTDIGNNEDLANLLQVCQLEQMERKAYDYLTQDQTADLLGNDNAYYVWDGDDLYYLAHPDQHDDNY